MVQFFIKIFLWFIDLFLQPISSVKKTEVIDNIPLSPTSEPMTPTIEQLVQSNSRNGFIGMCKRITKEEKLTPELTTNLLATLECEANFNNELTHPNKNAQGKTLSTDYYICQINDFYHIGKGKNFPSIQYVHDHPDEVVRWMCKQFKTGYAGLWVCYSGKDKDGVNYYKKYLKNYPIV